MAVAGAARFEHMRRLWVVPPAIARQRLGEAGVLDRVALQPLADKGKRPGSAAKAQGGEHLAAALGRRAGDGQLLLQISPEINAAAVVQQALQPCQGGGMFLLAAAQAAIAAAQGEPV